MLKNFTILIVGETTIWHFLQTIELLTGIAVISSAFIVGVILYFLEGRNQNIFYFIFHSYGQVFFVSEINLKSPWSRLVQVSFWFGILILASSYTALMADTMIEENLFRSKSHISKIYGKRIGANDAYQNIIKSYGAFYYPLYHNMKPSDNDPFFKEFDIDGIINIYIYIIYIYIYI